MVLWYDRTVAINLIHNHEVSEVFLYLLWDSVFCRENTIWIFPNDVKSDLISTLWIIDYNDFSYYSDNEILEFLHSFNDVMLYCDYLQKLISKACQVTLDIDFDEGEMNILPILKRWYIFSRTQTEPIKEVILKHCSEITEGIEIVRSGQPFRLDKFSDFGEDDLNYYGDIMDFSFSVYELVAKYKEAEIEKLTFYNVQNCFGLLYAEFWQMVLHEKRLKKCGYCGRYFIPFSENTEYCNRIIKSKGKSCKEYAPMHFYRQRNKGDELTEIYTKADSAHYKRHARNPNHYTWEQFETWRYKAKDLLEKAKSGKISADVFRERIKPNVI